MKYLCIILVSLLFLSCDETSSVEKGTREILPHPEKLEHDGYHHLPDSLKPVFQPDIQIGPIQLLNKTEIESYLGDKIMDRLSTDVMPSASVFSSNKVQKLTVHFHPGSTNNEFAEFEVSYGSGRKADKHLVKDKEFITESGIKLGMTIGDLSAIKGEPTGFQKGVKSTFYYEITEENSTFLQTYNMPKYYAVYRFNNGYLQSFKFGFEYP